MQKAVILALAVAVGAWSANAQTKSVNYYDQRMIERRAVEAAIWGMPAVNYDLMREQMLVRTAARANQVLYWGKPLDWHNQTLTPNPDSIYFMVFFDTHDGPIVIEIPPADGGSINGNIVTAWQVPLEDVGPAGADAGQGGRYLILPPGFDGDVPEGYFPLQSETYGGFALLRSNLASHADADVAAAVKYGRLVQVYPLAEAAAPPETVFVEAGDVIFDSTIRYDERFYHALNRVVQEEPWLDRDRAMIDPLRTVGIEKGQPFEPDQDMKGVFDQAVKEAGGWLKARYDAGLPPFWEGSHWTYPAPLELITAAQDGYRDADSYPIDARGLAYTYAYVALKRLGAGQFYLLTIKDSEGRDFEGAHTYRLTVPSAVPVTGYWSATGYDRYSHALIRNMPRASRSSQIPDLVTNADGSIDLYFGPKAPQGMEPNWIPTDPDRPFEVMFRLYGPTPGLSDGSWVLPDIERVP